MRVVVVGGHSRNIGKTAVMAGLIHGLRTFGWTAVKITQYGHGICSLDGEPCGCAPTEHAFVLSEESDTQGSTDTARFLAAGARRSLWLRVRQGCLGEALPELEEALRATGSVMIESNSILDYLRPDVHVAVLDSARRDFKPSAREHLASADALVPVESRLDARAWEGVESRWLAGKPRFPVEAGRYRSSDLCRFVRQKLRHPEAAPWTRWAPAVHTKEVSWRH